MNKAEEEALRTINKLQARLIHHLERIIEANENEMSALCTKHYHKMEAHCIKTVLTRAQKGADCGTPEH